MLSRLKKIFTESKRSHFNRICNANGLKLDYEMNSKEIGILIDIFENREYADYFPFYRKATIIDVGAHYGYFSLFASLNTLPGSVVISLEPDKSNYEKMMTNIQHNALANIKVLNCAMTGKNEVRKLYKGKSINNSLMSEYALADSKNATEVNIITLPSLLEIENIDNVDFLKLDCEGAEYEILENTDRRTFDKINTISMEFHDLKNEKYTGQKLIEILTDNNFNIVKYQYGKTTMGFNYGKIVGTKILLKK